MPASFPRADLNFTALSADLTIYMLEMPLSSLPFEVIVGITAYLHISDVVDFALTSSYFHSCCKQDLEVHQHKLNTLSAINDRNRYNTIQYASYAIVGNPNDRLHDSWYHRKVELGFYHYPALNDLGTSIKRLLTAEEYIAIYRYVRGIPPDISVDITDVPEEGWNRKYIWWTIRNLDHLFLAAIAAMDRIRDLKFKVHPTHGNNVHRPTVHFGWPSLRVGSAQRGLGVLIDFLERLSPKIEFAGTLRSIDIDYDELHDYNQFGSNGQPLYPQLIWADIALFFKFPNLKKLSLARHPRSNPILSLREIVPSTLGSTDQGCFEADGQSPIEELILSRIGANSDLVQAMIQKVKYLRVMVFRDHTQRQPIFRLIQSLEERHTSSLETLRLPAYMGAALQKYTLFDHLHHITLSYVDVMTTFSSHGRLEKDLPNMLSVYLPDTIVFLEFVGGRLQTSATGWALNPAPSQEDVALFLEIVVCYVKCSHQEGGDGFSEVRQRRLESLCFGDMRVQVTPHSNQEDRKLHDLFTEEYEEKRLQLNTAVAESQELRDACSAARVTLHLTDLRTKMCDHYDQHPYRARIPPSHDELRARARELSKGADPGVQAVLSDYASRIPP